MGAEEMEWRRLSVCEVDVSIRVNKMFFTIFMLLRDMQLFIGGK